MAVSAEKFKQAMRCFPAAVNLVTCTYSGVKRGLTATAVCSLCAEPHPSLLVCINRSGSTYECLKNARSFAVNVLAAGQEDIAMLFASSRAEDRARRFSVGRWTELASGAPILERAALAFDCELSQEIEYGTHSIIIGTVIDLQMKENTSNLLYVGGIFAAIEAPEAQPT